MPALHPKPQADLFEVVARPLTRRTASPASQTAAGIAERRAADTMRALLRVFLTRDATADEAAAAIGCEGLAVLRCRPRCSNLLHAGFLELTGEQRPSARGAPADELRITPAGRTALATEAPLPRPSKVRTDAA